MPVRSATASGNQASADSSKKADDDGTRTSHTIEFDEKLFRTVDYRLITSTYTVSPQILGSGNFGKVFLAHHNVNKDFRVAVKTLQKKKIGDNLKKLK
jgi:serine/threonine protein kinase